MFRASFRSSLVGLAVRGLLVAVAVSIAKPQAAADGPHGGHPPVYQRKGSDWGWRGHDRRHDKFDRRMVPQVSSAWFQRPYPYHLDYYKMRWGGSYAPYYGNLYGTPFGTPQVVYGGGLGAGGWGAEGYGYGPGVYGGQPIGFPGVPYSYSMMPEYPVESAAPTNGQAVQGDGENSAAPKQ